jgi:DNA-binding NtrC family response regulator
MTGRTLLIIDDEPAIGLLIARAGTAAGYRSVATSEAEAFKDSLRASRPSVICVDLAMPGVDGIELLKFLAAERCIAQLLIISGFDGCMLAAALALAKAQGLNIVGTLAKPIQMAGLKSLLIELSESAGED